MTGCRDEEHQSQWINHQNGVYQVRRQSLETNASYNARQKKMTHLICGLTKNMVMNWYLIRGNLLDIIPCISNLLLCITD